MNIVLMVSGIQPGMKESLALTTLHLARQLTTNGHHVTVISRNKWKQPVFEVVDGITFVRTKSFWKFPLYNKLLAFPFAVGRLKRKDIDVIHGFSASPVLVLRSLIARIFYAKNARVVHTLKSYPIRKDVKEKRGSVILSRLGDSLYRLLNYADVVTVPTEAYMQKLVHKGVHENKIKVVHSFVDLEKFFPQDRCKLKKKYGYQDKVIFHYGSMWEIKGTGYLISSLPLIIKKIPSVKLVLAPRNPEQALEKYMPIVKKLKVEEHVEFVLRDIKIEDYVNLADVVVLPYPHLEGTEGNPSCLLEALACGTPVVSTALPELEELFSDCAVLVKPMDIRALADGVISVLNGNNSQLVEKGLKKVNKFGIDKITRDFLHLYHS